jgi:hypothetical protein
MQLELVVGRLGKVTENLGLGWIQSVYTAHGFG